MSIVKCSECNFEFYIGADEIRRSSIVVQLEQENEKLKKVIKHREEMWQKQIDRSLSLESALAIAKQENAEWKNALETQRDLNTAAFSKLAIAEKKLGLCKNQRNTLIYGILSKTYKDDSLESAAKDVISSYDEYIENNTTDELGSFVTSRLVAKFKKILDDSGKESGV